MLLRERRTAGTGSNSVHVLSVSGIVKDAVGAACACRQDIFVGVMSQDQELELTREALLEPLRPSLYQTPIR